MPISLSKAHRKLLENTTAEARVLAENACKAALENLAVHEKDYRAHMADKPELRDLRNRLRARGRALGDKRDERTSIQGIHLLTELAAYEHWHRLLFTRFLTENHLLITDEANGSVPITLQECEELAPELGARDGFDLACRFAGLTLPGVFRRDDPVLELPVAMNDQVELRKLLGKLPSECFLADDALGWTYQFWQAQRKKEVNDSGGKIGADELSPVTQLFTEDYMVEFLLHNTVGAWWAGKLGPIQADSEEDARTRVALSARDGLPAITWTYLRLVQNEATKTWLPAAGTFDGWPKSARLIRLLDPCMGSGHFLVFALPLLVRLRMEEEQLEARPAVIAALKDNIHGLELDERCTQIAAFNVALTAWKLAGYQGLPPLHLACSGIAPSATEAEWTGLAFDDDRLRRGMVRLYNLFSDAPMLGSLINPGARGGSLIEAEFNELAPLLNAALLPNASQETKPDNDSFELGVIAQGLAKAAEMLADHFCLVATNVPFVGMKKQDRVLKEYCERVHPKAKADLATCFVERGLEFCQEGGTTTLVTPQNWLFLGTYRDLRREMLIDSQWDFVARLGPRSFQTPMYDFSIVLLSLTKRPPATNHPLMALDVGEYSTPTEKASSASLDPIIRLDQSEQLKNPDERIALTKASSLPLLQEFVTCLTGALNGDSPRFMKQFWEFRERPIEWVFVQSTVDKTIPFGGRDTLLYFDEKHGHLREDATIRRERLHDSDQRGNGVWGKKGLLVHRMGNLPATFYSGDVFDQNGAVIVPAEADLLAAVWSFVTSKTFLEEVRRLDNKVGVTPATLAKVPFDLPHWKRVAEEKFPHGLPQPHSENPSQWLFDGHPKDSEQPLHVAVSRLLGYRWPRQTGSNFPDCPALGSDGLEAFSDHDGVVCLPPVNREQPAANRLRQLLTAALGVFDERSLIASAGLKGSNSKTLEDWLRDEFFEQHAKLFHDRPFIWHLWDGRSDGFHALVNYHKLDHASLQKLTYSYLGNWIQQQAEDSKAEKPGAAARVGAAQALQRKLAAILEGEAPLDIFVRWKSIKDQSQGWNPDLNDGIRQNIRPFLLAGDVGKRGAGLFRVVPLGLKDNDRGTDPIRSREEYPWFWCESEPGTDPVGSEEFVGTRWNSVHLTLAKKRGAKA